MDESTPAPRRYGLPKLRSKARERLAQAYADDDLDLEDYERRVEAIEAASSVDEVFEIMNDVPDFAAAGGVGQGGAGRSEASESDAEAMGHAERGGRSIRRRGSERAFQAGSGGEAPTTEGGPGTAIQILVDRDLDISDVREGAVRIFSLLGDTKVDLTHLAPGQTAEVTDFGVLGDFKIEVPVGTEVVRRHVSILGDVVRKRAKERAADGPSDDVGRNSAARRVVFRGFRLLGDVKIVER